MPALLRITSRSLFLAILVALSSSQAAAAEDELTAQIKALQTERIVTLSNLAAYCKGEFEMGMMHAEAAIDADADLLKARLDAAAKPDERIAILSEHVKGQTELLKLIEGRRQAATVGLVNVYRARSLLLNTKIMLLRERSLQKAAKK